MIEIFHHSTEFNNIVVDFNSEMCKCISFGYFFDGDEVARSHYNYVEKIRSPMIKLHHLCTDLTNGSMTRRIRVSFGYTLLAYRFIDRGLLGLSSQMRLS